MEENLDTKTKILVRAEELFLRYGIKSVTMDDISKALGMSKKTLYQYVENKTDLLAQIMAVHIEQDKTSMNAIHAEAANAIDEMLRIAKFVIRDLRRIGPTTMYDLQKYYRDIWDKMEAFHKEYIYTVIKNNLDMGVQQGLYRANINTDVVAKLYVGKTLIVADEEMFPQRDYNREQLFKEYFNYHIHGIASEKGLELLKQQSN